MKISASKFTALALWLWLPFSVLAAQKVTVGVYDYPPFYIASAQSHGGVTPDIIRRLNQTQQEFEFELVTTTSRRRYQDFEAGLFDLMLFESAEWGWQNYDVVATEPFFSGGEVWIAYAIPERDQHYFETIGKKRLLGVLGYHYGFAALNSDPDYLKNNFSIHLLDNQEKIINLIAEQRADMGIVALSFLNNYLHQHPGMREKLLISKEFDQTYEHGALRRKDAPLSVDWLNRLFSQLQDKGELDRLWYKHHLREKEELYPSSQ